MSMIIFGVACTLLGVGWMGAFDEKSEDDFSGDIFLFFMFCLTIAFFGIWGGIFWW